MSNLDPTGPPLSQIDLSRQAALRYAHVTAAQEGRRRRRPIARRPRTVPFFRRHLAPARTGDS